MYAISIELENINYFHIGFYTELLFGFIRGNATMFDPILLRSAFFYFQCGKQNGSIHRILDEFSTER